MSARLLAAWTRIPGAGATFELSPRRGLLRGFGGRRSKARRCRLGKRPECPDGAGRVSLYGEGTRSSLTDPRLRGSARGFPLNVPVVVVGDTVHKPRNRNAHRGGMVLRRYTRLGELPLKWPANCCGYKGYAYVDGPVLIDLRRGIHLRGPIVLC